MWITREENVDNSELSTHTQVFRVDNFGVPHILLTGYTLVIPELSTGKSGIARPAARGVRAVVGRAGPKWARRRGRIRAARGRRSAPKGRQGRDGDGGRGLRACSRRLRRERARKAPPPAARRPGARRRAVGPPAGAGRSAPGGGRRRARRRATRTRGTCPRRGAAHLAAPARGGARDRGRWWATD